MPFPPGWDAERVRMVLEHYQARYERYVLDKIARGRTHTLDEVNPQLSPLPPTPASSR